MDIKTAKVEKRKTFGGRPHHEGWQLYHFEKVTGDKGKLVAKCMKCKNIIQNTTISRFVSHRKKCGNLPVIMASTTADPFATHTHIPSGSEMQQIGKIEMEEYENAVIQEDQTQTHIIWTQEQGDFTDETANQSSIDIINEDIKRHRQSAPIKRHKTDSPTVDVALASFIIGCQLTFDVVDSKHFKSFVNALNPDYKPPTSSELTVKVLSQLKGGEGSAEKTRGRKRRYSSDSD